MQETMNTADQQIFRTAGFAGIIGSVVFIGVFVVVGVFIESNPATTPVEWVERFELIRYARAAENGGYMLALILYMACFLGLHRAAHPGHAGFALFGSGLCVVGLGSMLAGALTHVAVTPLHELYYAEAATAADQAALALMWLSTWGILNALFVAGLAPVAVGLTMLGVAMLRSPHFRKWFSGLTLILGVANIAVLVVILINPDASEIAAISIFGLIFFNIAAGWRLTRLPASA